MDEPYRLLVVDDDADVRFINQKYFKKKGFEVRAANDGRQALKTLEDFSPHCILLDVMMPGMDGFELLEAVRRRTAVPVLFLTGRVEEEAKVKGLMLGADDYVAKPYSLAELEARIIANIRRHTASAAPKETVLSFPPLEIDIESHQATCDGQNLNLSNREYDILYLLASRQGKLVTFEEIGNRIWGTYQPADRGSLMVCVSRLRKKMDKPIDLAGMVETVWGKGYRFVPRGGRP